MNIYAVYKGEEFLCEGTVHECAEYLKVKPETVWWWGTIQNKKRGEGKTARGKEKKRRMAFVIGRS